MPSPPNTSKVSGFTFLREAAMAKSATIWIDPQTRKIAVRTAGFDSFFNGTIKALLQPPATRGFDFARKIWLVDQMHMEKLQSIFEQCGYTVQDGTLAQEAAPSNGHSPYHDLLADLPVEVLRKVYRVLALEYHPDRGGDHVRMTAINEAWKRIQELKK